MVARRPWYRRARWYGDVSDTNRPKPCRLPIAEIMRKLASSPTATARLRMIVGSGATRHKPLRYGTRAPRGSLPLHRWGLVRVRNNERGTVCVWPLKRGADVCALLPALVPARANLSTAKLVAALGGSACPT